MGIAAGAVEMEYAVLDLHVMESFVVYIYGGGRN